MVNLVASLDVTTAIQYVYYTVDTHPIVTVNQSPWSAQWDSNMVASGTHTLAAVVNASTNPYSFSAPVTIQVTNAPLAPTFTNITKRILWRCDECHSTGYANFDSTSYSGVMAYVTAGSPSGSAFYTKIASGSMPTNGRLTAEDATLVSDWIAAGAPNN
jgi:hypothetical protein